MNRIFISFHSSVLNGWILEFIENTLFQVREKVVQAGQSNIYSSEERLNS